MGDDDWGGGMFDYSGSDEYIGDSDYLNDYSDYGMGDTFSGDWSTSQWDWTQPEQVTEIPNTAQPGQTKYGWKYYSDGTAVSPDGKYYSNGQLVWSPEGGGFIDKLGQGVASALKKAFTDKDGNVDMRAVAGAAGGLYGLYKGMQGDKAQKVGYQGGIPSYTAVREQIPVAATPAGMQERRPGSVGRRYFTDVKYVPKSDTENITAAQTASAAQADALSAAQTPNTPIVQPETQQQDTMTAGERQTFYDNLMNQSGLAHGGIAALKQGRYLKGGTDGMADKISTNIDGRQPAALSHGEFVIPADVVSHLGNGNSEAGAERLYSMMDRIRKARTGTTKQGKQINPNKHLPA
jgi:hypothetical protein